MLKGSLGFMSSPGFCARSQPGYHIATIDFVRVRIDKKHAGLLTVSTVCGGSRTRPPVMTPHLFLATMPSRLSEPPATISH
jgi:hypothetical protein